MKMISPDLIILVTASGQPLIFCRTDEWLISFTVSNGFTVVSVSDHYAVSIVLIYTF